MRAAACDNGSREQAASAPKSEAPNHKVSGAMGEGTQRRFGVKRKVNV